MRIKPLFILNKELSLIHYFITVGSTGVTDQSVISPAISTMNMSSNSMVNDSVDVNIYFNRLYSNSSNAYALSVDDFLDLMTRFKDSPHQRDKVNLHYIACIIVSSMSIFVTFQDTLQKIIQALFEESKFYHQYPEHELYITAQFFGGLIDRGLLTAQMLLTAFRILLESLKTLNGNNLWKFGLATLDRCKTRFVPHCLLNLRENKIQSASSFMLSGCSLLTSKLSIDQ